MSYSFYYSKTGLVLIITCPRFSRGEKTLGNLGCAIMFVFTKIGNNYDKMVIIVFLNYILLAGQKCFLAQVGNSDEVLTRGQLLSDNLIHLFLYMIICTGSHSNITTEGNLELGLCHNLIE